MAPRSSKTGSMATRNTASGGGKLLEVFQQLFTQGVLPRLGGGRRHPRPDRHAASRGTKRQDTDCSIDDFLPLPLVAVQDLLAALVHGDQQVPAVLELRDQQAAAGAGAQAVTMMASKGAWSRQPVGAVVGQDVDVLDTPARPG